MGWWQVSMNCKHCTCPCCRRSVHDGGSVNARCMRQDVLRLCFRKMLKQHVITKFSSGQILVGLPATIQHCRKDCGNHFANYGILPDFCPANWNCFHRLWDRLPGQCLGVASGTPHDGNFERSDRIKHTFKHLTSTVCYMNPARHLD